MSDLVEALYREFEDACHTYLPRQTCERLKEAFLFARTAHGDQIRESGEPYITHPLTVAHYLAKLYVDDAILVGALLHDVAEDTPVTLDDIEARFGTQARHLVDGVTHLRNVSQLEDIAHLFLAMSSDVRVVLIKLFDRLHNLETLDSMPVERRRRKALETLRVYVPLAAKLGMWQLKKQFETLILYNLDPDAYRLICEGMDERFSEEEPKLREIARQLQELLRENGIPSSVRINQRSPYRIYENMTNQKLDNEAFNRAFQIVLQVDSIPQCYLALGSIHSRYPHARGRLFDSIGNPRDTFYRTLSTSVVVPDHDSPIPIRIRTYHFDRLSEIGILTQIQFAAAHEEKQPHDAPWLPKLPELYSESENAQKFVESVFQDILQKHLVCFTPRGEEISLPRGATILDFAYHVHTAIGHECRGAIVNGRPAAFSQKLADGDQVQIIRSRGGAPSYEWLDDTLGYVKTSRAKRKIREWFRRQDSELSIRRGRETLREERRRLNLTHITAQMVVEDFQLDSARTLYLQIGSGTISASDVALAMLKRSPDLFDSVNRDCVEIVDNLGQHGWLARIGDTEIRLAKCCTPHIGDGIIAHVTENYPVARIHRSDCSKIMRSRRTDNLVRVKWLPSTDPLAIAYLRLEAYDRGGLIRDISMAISEIGANIIQLDSMKENDHFVTRLKLELENVADVIAIIHRVGVLQNVYLIQRMNPSEIQLWEAQTAHLNAAKTQTGTLSS